MLVSSLPTQMSYLVAKEGEICVKLDRQEEKERTSYTRSFCFATK